MQLTQIQFLTGLFSLILAVISIYLGLYIASRYRKNNNKILLYVGISWVGLFNGWWPSAISFILILTTGNQLPEMAYFIIGNVLIPFWLLLWMMGVTELLYKEKQKKIILGYIIFAIFYESVFFYYLLTGGLGTLQGPVDVKYIGLYGLLLVILMIIVLITGVLFARESLKAEDPENKLRGKFILYAFIVYPVCAILDAALDLTVITLPIVRIMLITSTIAFYVGILMPNYIKRIFLKSE